MKKILTMFLSLAVVFSTFAVTLSVGADAHAWNTTGNYVMSMEYLGTNYSHDMTLVQDGAGNLTGNGGSPAGANENLWTIQSGSVVGNAIEFTANYTAPANLVTPQIIMSVEGTIAQNGSMSGTWSDNYSSSTQCTNGCEDRSGTWNTTSGFALQNLLGTLSSEDFAVVSYNTGLGTLSGYTAGFGLTDATFAGAQSVVVQLFSGTTLLQTNTAIIPAFNTGVTGTQFSSPFDVSGTYNYVTDGYWVNTRESEYGQSVPATKVVATVTLQNGKIITATNTTLVGDPETIFDEDDPSTVKVTIEKFVQGVIATSVTAENADFPMTATWDAENIGTGTSAYMLSETNTIPYHVVTEAMTIGADYETMELVNGDTVGAQCATGTPFALQGYTVGNSKAEAMVAIATTSTPSFTNLQNDKYVIVWNRDCSLPEVPIGGDGVIDDGVLAVTSIDMVDTTARANGSFSDGWKYVFNITAPMSEENVAMKFNNWVRTGGNGTIPVASNMRISSAQADNGGATILLTAENVYSTPSLHMTGDLNPALHGRQVQITVEVAVPRGTPNGSYTTFYGVQSL